MACGASFKICYIIVESKFKKKNTAVDKKIMIARAKLALKFSA